MSARTAIHRHRASRKFVHRPRLELLERRDLLASYTTPEDTALLVSDPALAGLFVVKPPEHGVVQRTNAGGFAYLPAKDYFGPDRFTYVLLNTTAPPTTTAPNVPGDVKEVTIDVTPVNDPPVALPNEYAALRNTKLTVAAPGVLKNDKDVDSPQIKAILVSQAASGVVSLADDGSFTYTPAANFAGPDSFIYRASDGTAQSGDTKVFIHVRSLPDARDDQYSVAQNGVLNVPPRGVLANDVGIEGQGLQASLEVGDDNGPKNGVVTLNADGSFSYKPNPGYFGPDSFVYRATAVSPVLEPGSTLASPIAPAFDVARVHIYVRPNAVVRANADVFETLVNKPLVVLPPGVLRNDFVFYAEPAGGTNATAPGILPPNAPLIASLVAGPEVGDLVLRENGSFEYKPKENFSGTVTFTYQAKLIATASGTPPLAAGDANNQRGDIATVTIHVKAPQPPPGPVARDDFYLAAANTPLSIRAPGVLANDSFPGVVPLPANNLPAPNVQPLTAVLVAPPEHGTLALKADGSFEYVPDANFVGIDSFKYQASLPAATDPATGSTAASGTLVPGNVATVTIRVAPALARNDEYSTLAGVRLDIKAPGVLRNDAGGSEDHPLKAVLVSKTIHGALELQADGSFVYTPEPNFTGTDMFVYRATSDLAANDTPLAGEAQLPESARVEQQSQVAIVKIHVRAAKPTVQAYPDKYATPQNVALVVPKPGLFANDYALVNHRIEASLAEGPTHGTVTVNGDGSFTYVPAENFAGEDKFVYKATDLDAEPSPAGGTTNVSFATVVIRVHAEPTPPKFIPGGNLRTTDASGRQQIAEWATLLSLAGERLPTFTVSTDRPQLFLTPPAVDAAGQLTYTPAPNVSGTAQVTVTLDGDSTEAGTTTFSIAIDKPHRLFNAANAYDVTGDRAVLASDALAVINHINAFGTTSAIAAEGEAGASLYLDVSQDNVITALDALLVINHLNAGLSADAAAEGEGTAANDLSLLALLGDGELDCKRKRA